MTLTLSHDPQAAHFAIVDIGSGRCLRSDQGLAAVAAESAQLKKNASVAAVVLPGGEEVAGGWSISSTIVYIYIFTHSRAFLLDSFGQC